MATATRKLERAHLPDSTRKSARAQLPAAARELVGCIQDRGLLTWARALSFQLITAVVPFLLFAFGLIGFLSLDNAWSDIPKNIKPPMSAPAFKVAEQTAKKVLTQEELWWVTLGFALAIWQVSGGIRTIMGGLNVVYELEETRSWFERMRRSIALALIVSALVLSAIAVAWGGPLLYGDVGQPLGAVFFLARWAIAAVLLGLATALTVRLAPGGHQSAGWVSVGTAIVVGAWVIASILFGAYIRFVASYQTIFGNLATVVILCGYIYLSSMVFFAGAQAARIISRAAE